MSFQDCFEYFRITCYFVGGAFLVFGVILPKMKRDYARKAKSERDWYPRSIDE